MDDSAGDTSPKLPLLLIYYHLQGTENSKGFGKYFNIQLRKNLGDRKATIYAYMFVYTVPLFQVLLKKQ